MKKKRIVVIMAMILAVSLFSLTSSYAQAEEDAPVHKPVVEKARHQDLPIPDRARAMKDRVGDGAQPGERALHGRKDASPIDDLDLEEFFDRVAKRNPEVAKRLKQRFQGFEERDPAGKGHEKRNMPLAALKRLAQDNPDAVKRLRQRFQERGIQGSGEEKGARGRRNRVDVRQMRQKRSPERAGLSRDTGKEMDKERNKGTRRKGTSDRKSTKGKRRQEPQAAPEQIEKRSLTPSQQERVEKMKALEKKLDKLRKKLDGGE